MKVLFLEYADSKTRERFDAVEGAEITYSSRKEVTDDQLAEAEVIMGNIPLSKLPLCKSLKWFQLSSAGANRYAFSEQPFLLTNASGAYGEAIAEYMLACALTVMKKLPEYQSLQGSHEWKNLGSVKTVRECRVLCVGMGDIGSAFAKKMKLLGAQVYGVRRTLHELPQYYDAQYTFSDMDSVIPECDIIAMSLPETPETIHVFNKDRLSKTKAGSILINVGRGSAIDTNALVPLARENHFSGVYLDVFEEEPLPKNSAVWNIPSIHCTPHISGGNSVESIYDIIMNIFYDNLTRYVKNEPLRNIVDRKLGY